MEKDPISEAELLLMLRQLNAAENIVQKSPLHSELHRKESGRIEPKNVLSIEDNQIHAFFDNDYGPFPTLEPSPPAIVLVNGKPIEGPTAIRPEDVIEWHVEEPPLFDITVSSDKIYAYLTVNSRDRTGWKLKSVPPGRHIVVMAEKDPAIVFERIKIDDIMSALWEKGITKNINAASIYTALKEASGAPVLIAQGVPPIPSEDAGLELYFSEKIEKSLQEINGVVDFKNTLHIPSASSGDVIARKIPAKPGTPGYNVFGEVIRPEQPKDILIVAKENVSFSPNGEIIALTEGRPRVRGDRVKFFDIASSYVVPGNVDIATGNIVFAGDVIIHGHVYDGMIVESLGNVYVNGNVYKSTITATGSIVVRGKTVLNSRLYSGYFGVTFNRLYVSLKKMLDQLLQFSSAFQQLVGVLESKGINVPLHQAAMTLIETKFTDLPKAAKELQDSIYSVIQLKALELEEVASQISIFARKTDLIAFKDKGQLDTILHRLREAYGMIERQQESDAYIDILQANASTLMATGNVMIRRKGVVQTDICSKGNIMFQGKETVCRGGVLESEGVIHAGTVGGETGVKTTLRAGKRISASKIQNCLIQVGRFKKTILGVKHQFEAYAAKGQFITRSEEEHENMSPTR